MHAYRATSLPVRLLAAGAMVAAMVLGSSASATVVRVNINGALGSGYIDLTVAPPSDPTDTIDASRPPLAITGASGTFNGATITGLHALNPAVPPPGEVLPGSYSLLSIPGYGDHGGVSYDNLFYLSDSPMICLVNGTPVYPFSGGLFDLMGVMFVLDNGNLVDLWSMGVSTPGFFGPSWAGGLTYGLKIMSPTDDPNLDGYQVMGEQSIGVTATVPEPDSVWLFGAAMVGLLAWRRSAKPRKALRVS